MDLALVLRELWERKLWLVPISTVAVLAGLVVSYNVSLFPPKAESDSFQFGTAGTRLLIDSQRSSILDVNIQLSALQERAAVYTQLITSAPVVRRIADELDVPAGLIEASALSGDPANNPETSAAERAQQLSGDSRVLRVFARAGTGPTITIDAEAPTGEDAEELANAAALGLIEYINDLQREQRIGGDNAVAISQLGAAQGSTINQSAGKVMGVFAFFGVLSVGIAALLLVPRIQDEILIAGMSGPARHSVEGGSQKHERLVSRHEGSAPSDATDTDRNVR